MHSDRKLIRNLFSLEKIEKQNKELMNNNIQINEKSTKISKKMVNYIYPGFKNQSIIYLYI